MTTDSAASHAASHGGHTGYHGVEHVDDDRAGNLRRVPQNDAMDGARRDFYPRVLGSNPSRLTTFLTQWSVDT